MLRQLLPAHAAADVLRQLQNRHTLAKRAAERVEHPHLVPLGIALLRHNPGQIVGAGQAAGKHHRDDAVKAHSKNLVELGAEILHPGQGRLGQFAVMQPLVNILAADVHTVQILSVLAQNPQEHKKDIVCLDLRPAQVSAGIRQQGDFLRGHSVLFRLSLCPLVSRGRCLQKCNRMIMTHFS